MYTSAPACLEEVAGAECLVSQAREQKLHRDRKSVSLYSDAYFRFAMVTISSFGTISCCSNKKLSICDIGMERQRNCLAHVSLTELNRSEHSPLLFRQISQAVDIQLHDAGSRTKVTSRAGTLRVASEVACSMQNSVSSNLVTLSSLRHDLMRLAFLGSAHSPAVYQYLGLSCREQTRCTSSALP